MSLFGFKTPWGKLKALGVIGLNERNADFIMQHNQRHYFPLVDNKIITKTRAIERGIPVPELYGHMELEHQSSQLSALLEQYNEFVIKPACGSGGNGILVIVGKTNNGQFRKANDTLISLSEIKHHISNILSGMYSLGGDSDSAIIEYCVQFDPCFQTVSYKGVPDIRLIVFRGVPLFAMIRLPTRQSDGRANLHQGAVGVGIDLVSGVTNGAVLQSQLIECHPDTGAVLEGLQIPQWEHILLLGAQCYELAPLGYLGVDIVLDRERGPLMLELNARPGLAIQIANKQGLAPILNYAKQLGTIPDLAEKRVKLGQDIHHKFQPAQLATNKASNE